MSCVLVLRLLAGPRPHKTEASASGDSSAVQCSRYGSIAPSAGPAAGFLSTELT